jgi:uncharacterized protein (TIGR03067 family)
MNKRRNKMKKMCWFTTMVCLAALLISGCAVSDYSRLQGDWTGYEVGGREGVESKITISGEQMDFQGRNSKDWYKAAFSLDEKTEPKQMNVVIQDCEFTKYLGTKARAIYKIEGETLTIAGNEPGKDERPVRFARSEETEIRLFVFSKEEAEK